MRFVRFFFSGEKHDIRSHSTAVWHCEVCGYDYWHDHIYESTYDKMAEKKCPECGSCSVEDRVHALKLRKTELDKKQTDIQKEIEEICKELETRTSIVTGIQRGLK
jgi:DNA-directed RNA polymerase beta' subunit